MNTQPHKIGYVALDFDDSAKQKIIAWAEQYADRFIFAVVDGKREGGNMTEKLHLTLFYGFDHEHIDQSAISDFLVVNPIDCVEIGGVGFFALPDHRAKIMFLKVKDDGNLTKIHEDLKQFAHLDGVSLKFLPHITIGYVGEDFDDGKLVYDGPMVLEVSSAQYCLKND